MLNHKTNQTSPVIRHILCLPHLPRYQIQQDWMSLGILEFWNGHILDLHPPRMPGRQNECVDLGIFVSMFLCNNPGSARFWVLGEPKAYIWKPMWQNNPAKTLKPGDSRPDLSKKPKQVAGRDFANFKGFLWNHHHKKKVTSGIARRNMERLVCWLGLGWLLLCSPPPCPTSFVGKMGWRWSGTLMWTWHTHTELLWGIGMCVCFSSLRYTLTESSSLYLKIDA